MSGDCNGNGFNYQFYGNYTKTSSFVFSEPNGPQIPHYQIRVMFWVILIDDWNSDDKIVVNFGSG